MHKDLRHQTATRLKLGALVFPLVSITLLAATFRSLESPIARSSTPNSYDINIDGITDILVSEPALIAEPLEPGWIGIESGSDNQLIWIAEGFSPYDYFGYAVEWADDLNGDGISDVIVSAPLTWLGDGLGQVEVYSGADGTLLFVLHGQPSDTFGVQVGSIPDHDNDGVPDLFATAHFYDQNRNIYEIEYIFSGADGSLLEAQPDSDGRLVRLASDVDTSGIVDPVDVVLVVGEAGSQLGEGEYNPADVNGDGIIDSNDIFVAVADQGLSVDEEEGVVPDPVLPRLSIWPVAGLDPAPPFGSTLGTSIAPGTGDPGGPVDEVDGGWVPPGSGPGGGVWIDGDDDDGSDIPLGSSSGDNGPGDDGTGPNNCGVSVSLSPVLTWVPYTQYPHQPLFRSFTALGSPSGGSYSWSVSGASYTMTAPNRIILQITKPGRITVTVSYTKDGCTRRRTVRFFAFHADIDVDSDNTNGFEPMDSTMEEDLIEDDTTAGPGKVLFTSIYDSDGDGVPDFADGLGMWDSDWPGDVRFVPVRVLVGELPQGTEYTIRFTYDHSDPAAVTRIAEAFDGPAQHNPTRYAYTLPGDGRFRLWKRPGTQIRNPSWDLANGGDFVASGQAYTREDLGMNSAGVALLWLEAVKPSDIVAADRIQMQLVVQSDPPPPRYIHPSITRDAVRLTASEIEAKNLLAWDPWLIDPANLSTSGLRLMDTDFADLSKGSDVQGAITDGVSGVLVRFTPPVGEFLPDAELRIVKKDESFTNYPRAVGGFSAAQEYLPSLPYSPATGGLSSSISASESMAFYFPPEAYLDPQYPQGSPVTLNSEEMCNMAFEIATNEGALGKFNFVLRRPPVLLVHGLKSNPSTWEPSIWRNSIEPPGLPTRVYTLDYEASNDQGYDKNALLIPTQIQHILDEYHWGNIDGRRYAAARVDYVGHSMGGVLARLYISDANTHGQGMGIPRKAGHWEIKILRTSEKQYLRKNNWHAGDIRRFISIGSPFRGSRWAVDAENGLKGIKFVMKAGQVVAAAREDFISVAENVLRGNQSGFGLTINVRYSGFPDAYIDLQPNSEMQKLMDASSYPIGDRKTRWHPIVCVASQNVDPSITKSLIWRGVFETLGSVTITGASEANGLNGDLIVSKQSQLIGQNESIGQPIEGNTIHASAITVNQHLGTNFFDETSSPNIVAQVRKLLSTDNTQDWQGSLKP